MDENRRPIGPEHTEVITPDGTHQVEIAPAGSCINFMQPHGGWAECEPAAVETLTGSSGRSRSVFTRMPLTVGVRTDADEAEIVTLRLSNDPSKSSEIAFTLVSIDDDGATQTVNLNEHAVDGQIVNKGGQVVDVVDASTLRLLTPYRAGIKSRKVIYSVTVPDGYAIVQGDTWPEIHDRNGYLRSLRAVLLDKDMQPVMDGRAEMPRPLDAIALGVTENGTDESGRPRYTLTKSSKVDLTSVAWEWFDIEVSLSSAALWSAASTTWTNAPTSSTVTTPTTSSVPPGVGVKYSSATSMGLRRFGMWFTIPTLSTQPIEAKVRLYSNEGVTGDVGIFLGTYAVPAVSAGIAGFSTQLGTIAKGSPAFGAIPVANIVSGTTLKLMFRRMSDDVANVAPTADTSSYFFGAWNAAMAPKLILVYPHSGPSKQLYFNDSLKPASGRVQFPVRINRADANGAAVLDGMLTASANYTTDFTYGLDSHIRTPFGSDRVTVDGQPAYRVTNNTQGAYYGGFLFAGLGNPLDGCAISIKLAHTATGYIELRTRSGPRWGVAVWSTTNSDSNHWMSEMRGDSNPAYSPSPINVGHNRGLEDVAISIINNGISVTSSGKILGNFSVSGWPQDAPIELIVSQNAGCTMTLKSAVVNLKGMTSKSGADLHFRKADGTLIPAFSRTVTKDANNAITQLDYRLSVDVADLSGLKLCYGDPAYSDFAVDAAQITGATVAQAETNPLPGTFWDYAAIITLVVPPAAWSPLVESNPAEPFRATHSFPQVFQVEAKIFAAILIRGDFVIYKNRNNTLVWTISRKPGESAGPDLTKITKMTLSLHDLVIQSDNTAGSALRWVSETPASGPVLRVTLDLGGVTNLPLGDIPAELVLFDANNAKGWVSVQKTITIKPSVGA